MLLHPWSCCRPMWLHWQIPRLRHHAIAILERRSRSMFQLFVIPTIIIEDHLATYNKQYGNTAHTTHECIKQQENARYISRRCAFTTLYSTKEQEIDNDRSTKRKYI